MEVPLKSKMELSYDSLFHFWVFFHRKQNYSLKKIPALSVSRSGTHSSQDTEKPQCPSMHKHIEKCDMYAQWSITQL